MLLCVNIILLLFACKCVSCERYKTYLTKYDKKQEPHLRQTAWQRNFLVSFLVSGRARALLCSQVLVASAHRAAAAAAADHRPPPAWGTTATAPAPAPTPTNRRCPSSSPRRRGLLEVAEGRRGGAPAGRGCCTRTWPGRGAPSTVGWFGFGGVGLGRCQSARWNVVGAKGT